VNAAERSLLCYLDAPVVVGDPEGRAVYANPAFEARFVAPGASALGRPLAELFEGGGREAVLGAVASVCEGGASVRFRVRERGIGFAAVASPIVAEDARIGVVILLKEEIEGVEPLLALHRDVQDPLDELAAALEALVEQTGGRRSEHYRTLLEEALRALARVRKWSDEMHAVISGVPLAAERFDAAQALRRVAACFAGPEAATPVFVLAPVSLPPVAGDATRLEAALRKMVERRLAGDPAPVRLILAARHARAHGPPIVWVSLTEHFARGATPAGHPDPPEAQETVAALAGPLHVSSDPQLGRTTLLRLAAGAA
jgi:hypothetical protein